MTFGRPAWPARDGRSRAVARGVAGDLPVVKSATFGGPFAKMMTRRVVCREVVLLLIRVGSLLLGRLLSRLAGPACRAWPHLALARGALLVLQGIRKGFLK